MKAASSLTTQGIKIKAKASIICTIVVSNYRMGGAFYYEREKVFNEEKGGAGIRLAVVKELLDQVHSLIHVSTTDINETCFTPTL